MCIFSGPVNKVSATNIFARHDQYLGKPYQYLAYSMKVTFEDPVAMILPIPVENRATEASVAFINLEEYPGLFTDLDNGFPQEMNLGGGAKSLSFDRSTSVLQVHEVGGFIASFAPTYDDMDRLDSRFRLPITAWAQLSGDYLDWGFAVFQLRDKSEPLIPASGMLLKGKKKSKAANREIHPMAFGFNSRFRDLIYVPTRHYHGHDVSSREVFDHTIYFQGDDLGYGDESESTASSFVDIEKTQNIVLGDKQVYRSRIEGQHPNKDIYIPLG